MTDEAWTDTVRLVRDHGDLSQLLPDDVDSVLDLPYKLFDALRQALVFLAWDELPTDDRPPRKIWRDGQQLKEWFDAVKERRDREFDPKRSIDDPVDNDAAKGLVVG